ncbi:MAG: hypothetical protein WC076_09720 [Terrimicrobiaceae bacterium]|nr:hypothetical protein [Terrimicrobiaceae bacterium]
MKTLLCLPLVLLAAVVPLLHASDSKRTAEYILTSPTDFEGKEVTLDVAFVNPVHWKSPNPELAFFHAVTLDRRDHKFGGRILVAIPSGEASKFAKKYGTDFEGRNESNSFQGTLITAPGGRMHAKVWILDSTGKVADLIKQHKLAIVEDEGGGAPGGRGPGFRRPGLN